MLAMAMSNSLSMGITSHLSLIVGVRHPLPLNYAKWSRLKRWSWNLYVDFVTAVIFTEIILSVMRILTTPGDIGIFCALTAGGGYLLQYLLKLLIFRRHKKTFGRLRKCILAMSRELETNGFDSGYSSLHDELYRRMIYISLSKGCFEFISANILVAIFVIKSIVQGVPQDLKTPGTSWTPYDNSKNPVYSLTCIFELIAYAGVSARNTTLDLTFWLMLAIPSVQLRYLNKLLKAIIKERQPVGMQYEESQFRYKFSRWIKYHQKILRTIQEFRCIASPYLAVNYLTTLLVFTLAGLAAISSTSWTIDQQIVCNALALGNIIQLYLVSLAGDWLREANADATQEGFTDDLVLSKTSLKNDFLFVCARTRHSLRIKFGGVNELSSSTFGQLIRLTMTYFTTILQLKTGDK